MKYFAIIFAACLQWSFAEPTLQRYNVDRSKISVSGISSGACMATQYHVAHSRDIMGAGIIAGGGTLAGGLSCMASPSIVSVSALEVITSSGSLFYNLDSTSHMRNDRVYIFDGTLDSVVKPDIGNKVASYYRHYMPSSHVKTEFSINAEHSMPTRNYGGPCNQLNSNSYLNNCNYDAAFHVLDHIYGGLTAPKDSTKAQGQLLKFSTSEFFHLSVPITYSMDSTGYIYVPSSCAGGHTMYCCRSRIGEEYVRHGGYNEVGELNDIIILYPQVVATPVNPEGCWDWYGYTGPLFATNKGYQITAVNRMISKVSGIPTSIIG